MGQHQDFKVALLKAYQLPGDQIDAVCEQFPGDFPKTNMNCLSNR